MTGGTRDLPDVLARLEAERSLAVEQETALAGDVQDVMDAAGDVATDDEHDPEGATVAFERARLTALRERAHQRVLAVDVAMTRARAGDYDRCEACGGAIGDERLLARPTVTTCIDCAR